MVIKSNQVSREVHVMLALVCKDSSILAHESKQKEDFYVEERHGKTSVLTKLS